MMKVVHLVTVKEGGAGRAAVRISDALCKQGIDSSVLTIRDIEMFNQGLKERIKRKISFNAADRKTKRYAPKSYFNFDLKGLDFTLVPQIQQADIIHLHWVADGMASNHTIERLSVLHKPIVWTLHDMHPFTGGCHYDEQCGRYMEHCGMCPLLSSNDERDITYTNMIQKEAAVKKLNLTVVGCSRWIANCAKKSSVFKRHKCITIPNIIDQSVYYPIDKHTARQALGIPDDRKKIILFGAMSSTSDKRKGFEYLKEALKLLNNRQYRCCVFGGCAENKTDMEMLSLGTLSDDVSLRLAYSAADVFVAPSLQENLANTVMESLACGTPVAAFRIGGMPDMIKDGMNGYMAELGNVEELGQAIVKCTEQRNTMPILDGTQGYIELYNSIYRKQ